MAALHAWLDLDASPDLAATTVRPLAPGAGPHGGHDWEPATVWEPVPETRPYDDAPLDAGWWEHPQPQPVTRVIPMEGRDELLDPEAWQPEVEAPARAGLGERLRRSLLTLALGSCVTAVVALAPYVALATLLVLVWLLRSGSSAASAARVRRETRGAKWYDGVQTLVAAPFHLGVSLLGTAGLAVWAGGLGAVVALLCFAVGAEVSTSLALVGAAVVVGLWVGPGAGRVRGPVRRGLVRPLATRGWVWLLSMVLLVAALGFTGAAVAQGEVVWTPAGEAPWSSSTWQLR